MAVTLLRSGSAGLIAAIALAAPRVARGDPPAIPPAAPASQEEAPPESVIDVVVASGTDRPSTPGRAGSRVDRRELSENLPRSAPDALRYEPGVYVQQTAHGQGSPFVRGRTGQQVLMLVDGIRLNNSTFRQGPNQYFFTVDARSIHSIDVLRGGASTQYGSDAIAGVIHARPIEPSFDPRAAGLVVKPRALARGATADGEVGFRAQLDAQLGDKLRFVGGFGSRRAGKLRASGPVCGAGSDEECTVDSPDVAAVPRFEEDGRTQLGTGFREVTGDARLVYALRPNQRLIAAAYIYRQFDAPRTDQCPPKEANRVECLTVDEQFRTLAYLSFRGEGPAFARSAEATISFQRQHERRTRDRPQSFIQNGGRDSVNTIGALFKLTTEEVRPLEWLGVRVKYGADFYDDRLDSRGWTIFTDNDIVVTDSRGQYVAGSAFTQGGAYADVELSLPRGIVVRGGARGGFALTRSPGDPETTTLPVDAAWPVAVGHVGVEARIAGPLRMFLSYDRSYRTPNLDDLTSRQQAGPGFQLENASLVPETANTFEAGLRVDLPFLEADLWGYHAPLEAAILRTTLRASACPPDTPQCNGSRAVYKLVNTTGDAAISGFEASARAFLPLGLEAKATVAFAFGEGQNPLPRPADPAIAYEERVPLSRIPPWNGTAELRWESPFGLYVGAALRWALDQDRLAIPDRSDPRIPPNGTPGFAVFDARAGYRLSRYVVASLVVENVGDSAYRYHGSSVDGAERGLLFSLEGGL